MATCLSTRHLRSGFARRMCALSRGSTTAIREVSTACCCVSYNRQGRSKRSPGTVSSSSGRKGGEYDESRGLFVPWLLTLGRNGALHTPRLKSERQRRSDHTEATPPKVAIPQCEEQLDEGRGGEKVRALMGSLNSQ